MIDFQLAQAWKKLTGSEIQELPCDNDYETGELYILTEPVYIPIPGLDTEYEKQRQEDCKKYHQEWEQQMQNGSKAWAYLLRRNNDRTGITLEDWVPIPDLEEQPWEWVKAFIRADIYIEFGDQHDPYLVVLELCGRGSGKDMPFWEVTGDTPEAALEAAIRAWEQEIPLGK